MDIEAFREYCLAKKGVTEGMPFGDNALVFKVMEKMFALLMMLPPPRANLKCDPERAIELREEHSEIIPGYHMSKIHWNTVSLDDGLSQKLILELIDHSYDLVVAKLRKADRAALKEM